MGKTRIQRTPTQKTCWKCRALKLFREFYKGQGMCIICSLATNKEWCLKNRDLRRVHRKRYYEKHRAICISRGKEYRLRNPGVNRKAVAKWRKNNLAKAKFLISEWAKRNREKRNFSRTLRRFLRRANGGERIRMADWEEVKRRYEFKCIYCKKRKKLTMDHRIPISRGGRHEIANLDPVCASCNSRKRHRTDVEFRRLL